ncbi:MAG TPA: trigger factor [Ramlibacter sp.]|nr:trigger factor [Ramlibacter sp.]
MQVSLENTTALERRMTVSLPAERLEGAVGNRLREIARTANLKGFRRGKVPTKVIEQRFGAQVRSEAFGELVRESFDEAVREQHVTLAGNPSIQAEPKGENGEIRYTATFEVVPDFGKIDVSTLKFNRPTAVVADADIDEMIGTLRQQRRTWNPVERAAQAGDLARVETFARTADERIPAEGVEQGAAVLGSNVMYPQIEAGLEGMSAGEEKEIDVSFPADWRVPALAGQTAKVHVKVLQVAEAVLPELDDAFVKSFGIKGGKVETFRKEVRANLERELKGTLMARLRAEVAQKLVAAYAQVELPPRLIEAEARSLANAAAEQARQQGQNVKMLPENFMVPARNRIAAGLLVGEIARQNDLHLDAARVRETLNLIASTYEDPAQVIELYRNDPNLMGNLRNRVMEEQVIDWIAERADATEQAMSFTEVMRPAA